ncbi:MAG: 4'-phosphopantetheinyl transferase family protein [Candidatus Promineifilaceae bacterium]
MAAGEIHVWRLELPAEAGAANPYRPLLAPADLARLERLTPAATPSFIASRAVLRCLLGRYAGRRPAGLTFGVDAAGKPVLEGDFEMHFNLSHSARLALLAFGVSPLGVDVERVRPLGRLDALARRVLAPAEWDVWAGLPAGARLGAFFDQWSSKEAVAKATGGGVGQLLRGVALAARPDGSWGVVALGGRSDEPFAWQVARLPAGRGYAAALAYPAGAWRLRLWRWDDGLL